MPVGSPRSPTVKERYVDMLSVELPNTQEQQSPNPTSRGARDSFEMTMLKARRQEEAARIVGKDEKIEKLEKRLVAQERDNELTMQDAVSSMLHIQQENQDKISEQSELIVKLKKEIEEAKGMEEMVEEAAVEEAEDEEEELEDWDRINDMNGHCSPTVGHARLGQITYMYSREFKKPLPRAKVIEKAIREASKLKDEGCIGFSVNMNKGVEFYSKDCYGDDGELSESAGWTFYLNKNVGPLTREEAVEPMNEAYAAAAVDDPEIASRMELQKTLVELKERCPDIQELEDHFMGLDETLVELKDWNTMLAAWAANTLVEVEAEVQDVQSLEQLSELAKEGTKVCLWSHGIELYMEDDHVDGQSNVGFAEEKNKNCEWVLKEAEGDFMLISSNHSNALATQEGFTSSSVVLQAHNLLDEASDLLGLKHDKWSILPVAAGKGAPAASGKFTLTAHNGHHLSNDGKNPTLTAEHAKNAQWSFHI